MAATCRVIPTNLLSGVTPSGEASATGYAIASLTDDNLGKAWRSSLSASSFQVLLDRGASAPMLSWIGAFDLVPVTAGVAITNVVLHDGPDGSSWGSELGRFLLNARGDGGKLVTSAQRWLRYTIQLSGNSQIDWGLAFAGAPLDFPRSFSRRRQNRDRGIVRHDGEGGGDFAGRLRSYREVIGLDFSILEEDEHQALMDLEDGTEGQLRPMVLIPTTSKPDELYHGRIEEVQNWERNPGAVFYEGHKLAFRESGRAR